MIIHLLYLAIGIIIGFLVKHELDVKSKHKRKQERLARREARDCSVQNETLRMVQELNNNLNVLRKEREVH